MNTNTDRTYKAVILKIDNCFPNIIRRVIGPFKSDDSAQLDAISSSLWTAKADSFLAHAKSGEGDDTLQPILLSDQIDAHNGARFIAFADGNWRPVEHDFDRVFYLFPPSHTGNARAAWRNLGEGVERRYWKQDGGKWIQGP